MDVTTHPDPFGEAAQHGLQRAVQIASVAVTAGQVYVYQQKTQTRAVAERDERARRALHTQGRAEREAARAGWAPALDPAWLRQATFIQTAQAWGAAMPYADRSVPWYEPVAATAMRKCEERLRELHPFGMARYDRLRDQGMSPAEAMTEAAPLFAGPPHAYDAPFTPRPMLVAGDGPGTERTEPGDAPSPGSGGGRTGGAKAEAASVAAPPASAGNVADLPAARNARVPAGAVRARRRRASRPWEHDFPLPIRDVLAAVSQRPRVAGTRQGFGKARQAVRTESPRP